MIYTCTILPYRLSFVETSSDSWNTADEVFNYIFMVDIVVNCVTAYQDMDNVLVTNNKYILINYLKTWFILDLASVYIIIILFIEFHLIKFFQLKNKILLNQHLHLKLKILIHNCYD